MRRTLPLGGRLAAILPIVALAVGAAGCGSDKEKPKPRSTSLYELLPESMKASKTLRVGVVVGNKPLAYYDTDEKTVIGIDPDIASAIGEAMVLKVVFVPTDAASLVSDLKADRYDIVMSGLHDTKANQKHLDLIDYFTSGTSILVRRGNPEFVYTLEDLCGHKVSLRNGSAQEDLVARHQATCTKAKKRPIVVLAVDSDDEAFAAVKDGRALGALAEFPVAAFAAKTAGGGGDFEIAGEQIEPVPLGIGVPKGSPEKELMREALRAGFALTFRPGTYDNILQRWGVIQGKLLGAATNSGKR